VTDHLAGARAKIERAKKHFTDLAQEDRRFMALNPYRIDPEYDPQTRNLRFKQSVFLQPDPILWGTLIGDAVHNLRSVFDHLAWQLVLANGNRPDWRTEFPVYIGDPMEYESFARRKVHGMAKGAITLIEHLQPYRAGSQFDRDPLHILNALDIEDKHHFLLVVGGAGWMPSLTLNGSYVDIEKAHFGGGRISPLIDGAETSTKITFGAGSEVDVKVKFTYYVAFDQVGPGRGEPVSPTLHQLIGFTEQALKLFAPLLV
jgi:hypothetical protein